MNKIPVILIILMIAFSNCFIDRVLYEEIKSKATFEVLEFDQIKQIFGDRTTADFSIHNGENHLMSEAMKEQLAAGASTEIFLDSDDLLKSQIVIPAEFDWRAAKPECLTPIKDQLYCGSCYSFSATAALESRICIQSGGKIKPELSQQDIISCDSNNLKCHGDRLDNTWKYLENIGTCSLYCKPYESGYGFIPACSNSCTDPRFTYYKWKAKSGTWKYFTDYDRKLRINKIKTEIYLYGPVSAGMVTYEDLSTYKGGIYIHTAGKQTDHHAIVIVGWGYDYTYKSEYWIIRNSWNSTWGERGYGKILMGMYEIDDMVNASQPLI